MIKRDPTRFVQIGFLALLFLCMLQVGYWVTENLIYTTTVQAAIEASTRGDLTMADALEQLGAASEGRTNRYIWEGAFFLIVLICGMAVLTRTLRHDAELRRRQQNFLAAVSHEFKSPLASMQLGAETLILRSAEEDSRRLGQRIVEDGERLLRMVDNLLDTTRLEEGHHALNTETVDVAAALGAIIDEFGERVKRHDIEITLESPFELSLSIDRGAFDTMLRNLIDNAVKACIAANGHEIRVRAERDDGGVSITVADDGLGFAPEDASLMFEKFYRLGEEQRRKTPGTGLGLYIVKRLADLSDAEVSAVSEGPNRGAAITLRWPKERAK